MLRITEVAKHLLIINILMFLAGFVFNTDLLALYYPGSENFRPFQLVTHFFMHAGFMHIFFNMFALVMFGSALETLWGPQRFLFYYFACAVGAAALHMFVDYLTISSLQAEIDAFRSAPSYDTFWAFFNDVPLDRLNPEYKEVVNNLSGAIQEGSAALVPQATNAMEQYVDFKMNRPVVGASGAIFGLLLAFGMKFPNAELMLIFFPVPVKAKYFIPILMLLELYLGVNNFSWDNIAHFAHLGGALMGLLLILLGRYFNARL